MIMELISLYKLFDIKYGNSFELINLEQCDKIEKDAINFVSRTEKNNGISAFVKRLNEIEPNKANTITVAVSGSVLSTFLQSQPYYTGFHIMVLSPITEMTQLELLFYAMCIRVNKYKYNYGRQANKTLKDILVPKKIPIAFSSVDYKSLNTLKSESINDKYIAVNTNNWKLFDLKNLFTIKGSKTTSLLELEECGKGIYPYVTTQATKNGVDGFFNFYTEEGNVLAIDSAVLGYCSFQPLNFSASDHVEKLIPKFNMNKFIALFFVTILNLEQYRYNYGRKSSQTRLRQICIKLPSKNNHPDFEFMENYIKSLPYSKNLL
jgi:hypothetical protein